MLALCYNVFSPGSNGQSQRQRRAKVRYVTGGGGMYKQLEHNSSGFNVDVPDTMKPMLPF